MSKSNNTFHEKCWVLIGRRRGSFWYARKTQPTSGGPASVEFNAAWVTQREETYGDCIGFYHTHPSGNPTPSKRDDRTMHAWVASFGKPLLCVIEAGGVPVAYEYENDEASARRLQACETFPRGVVLVYDDR